MKKSIFMFSASVMMSTAVLTSCSFPPEKVENAENKVMEAKVQLDNANDVYLAEVENYRKETEAKMAENDLIIDKYKESIQHDKKEVKAEYKKKVKALEEKNNELKKKLENFQVEEKEKWESFKAEFSHDMDELGKSCKDLTVNNVE